jgi:hypothetical protein
MQKGVSEMNREKLGEILWTLLPVLFWGGMLALMIYNIAVNGIPNPTAPHP